MIVVEAKRTRKKLIIASFILLGCLEIAFSEFVLGTAYTPLALIGNLFFMAGCGFWLKLKNRSLFHLVWVFFFSIIGVAIVGFLKDESKPSEVKENGKSNSNLH